MNLLNTKVVFCALGIVAVFASPAFAQKRTRSLMLIDQTYLVWSLVTTHLVCSLATIRTASQSRYLTRTNANHINSR